MVYRVHRLKDNLRQQFRWQPHLSGLCAIKPKDYDEAFTVEAETPYAAWVQLRGTSDQLLIGDLLADETGGLRILKYIGFEEASWIVPEPRQTGMPPPPLADPGSAMPANS